MEYSPDNLDTLLPVINPDGSVKAPGMMSVEEAMRLSEERNADPGPAQAAPAPEGGTEGERTIPGTDAPVKDPAAAPAPENAAPAPAPAKPGIELDTDDPPITVGGIAKPTSVWAAEMEAEYGVDTTGLPADARQKMIDGYINTKHKEVWQKQNTERAQLTGEAKRQAEELRIQAEARFQQAERVKMETEMTFKRLTAERDRIVKLASTDMKPEDLKDEQGNVDPFKTIQFGRILDARERMAAIEEELKTNSALLSKAEIDRTMAEIETFQSRHTEYQMTEPLLAVIQKVEGQGMKTHPDFHKLLDVYDILDYARSRGVPLDVAYERVAAQGKLTVRGTTASPAPGPAPASPAKPTPAQDEAQRKLLEGIRRKQAAAQPTLDGANARPARPAVLPKKTLGDNIREASQKAIGGGSNTALETMGY